MATLVPVTSSACGLEYSIHRELVTMRLTLSSDITEPYFFGINCLQSALQGTGERSP